MRHLISFGGDPRKQGLLATAIAKLAADRGANVLRPTVRFAVETFEHLGANRKALKFHFDDDSAISGKVIHCEIEPLSVPRPSDNGRTKRRGAWRDRQFPFQF